jgi:alcohol dehydrogenase class IV
MKRFYQPTEIISGVGSFGEVGGIVARFGRRALLVCGYSGALDRALKLLEGAGVSALLYDTVVGEPTTAQVEAGLKMARQGGVEVVLGIGGGSAMDLAKAVAGLYPYPGTVKEYHSGERKVTGAGLPWVAVPTTAGTGAEATKNAVLTDPEQGIKRSIRHDGWFARVAIADPELTLTLPPEITAATGSDALCQAIESYVSLAATPVTDALTAEAIRLVGRSLLRAWRHGDDLASRTDMLYGSMLSGMALANAQLGGVHGLAAPLGGHFNIPHGAVCGLLLPHIMAYNLDYVLDKYARVAGLLGCDTTGMSSPEAARRGLDRVRELLVEIGLPLRLREFNVPREAFPAIVEEALPASHMKINPRPLAAEDLQTILEAAW